MAPFTRQFAELPFIPLNGLKGFTALHLAADRGYLAAVKVLLAKGANIGVKVGSTLLEAA